MAHGVMVYFVVVSAKVKARVYAAVYLVSALCRDTVPRAVVCFFRRAAAGVASDWDRALVGERGAW